MSDPQSVEIFNSWDLYGNIVRNNWMRHEQMSQFIQNATEGRKLHVLDLGCGDGAMARNGLLGRSIEKYVGVDLSQDALDHLQRAAGLGIDPQVILGDIRESIQKLASQSFDLVLASYSLHHYQRDDKESILREIARVLTPQGRLLWIDIACLEGEDRSGYVSRIEHEIQTQWKTMPQKHREDSIQHIRNHDYPEQQSWMIQTWEKISCSKTEPIARVGFRDEFYIALELSV